MEYFSFTRQSNSDSFSNQHPCSRNLLCASTHWGKSPTNVDWVCPFSHVKWSRLAWRPRRQSDAFIVESLSMSMGCVKCATTCALWASYTYTKLDFFHLVFTCICRIIDLWLVEPPVHSIQTSLCDILVSGELTVNLSCISSVPGTDHEPGDYTFLLWTHG